MVVLFKQLNGCFFDVGVGKFKIRTVVGEPRFLSGACAACTRSSGLIASDSQASLGSTDALCLFGTRTVEKLSHHPPANQHTALPHNA